MHAPPSTSHAIRSQRGYFDNPWPPVQSLAGSAASLLRLPIARSTTPPIELHIKEVETVTPDFRIFQQKKTDLCATWLGHAGFLVQLPAIQEPGSMSSTARSIRIIFDPIFSERASPSSWFGPKRRLAPPCKVEDLPDLDFVVISHNHYDHLDLGAIEYLWSKSPTIRFLVPLGVKEIITSMDVEEEQVYELDWWDSKEFPLDDSSSSPGVVFTCTPAQHNSGRGIADQKRSLWASWAVRMFAHGSTVPFTSVYHAGDTGYQTADGPCPCFKEIGDRCGPFNLAMIPIWRGASLSFLGKLGYRLSDDTPLVTLHATPEDAVQLAKDVRARHSLAMHFATFAGSADEALEPLVRLAQAQGGESEWSKPEGFGAINMGECITIQCS